MTIVSILEYMIALFIIIMNYKPTFDLNIQKHIARNISNKHLHNRMLRNRHLDVILPSNKAINLFD